MNSCKDCKFAICSDNVQTGCECNKIEKFVEQNTASMGENGFYNLNRLCMFKRFECFQFVGGLGYRIRMIDNPNIRSHPIGVARTTPINNNMPLTRRKLASLSA